VIGYASRAFSEPETKYCTTRKELGAIMFGLKYYRHFLLGTKFVLRTDHAALSHLKRTPHPVAQSARFLNTLAQYDYDLQYRPRDLHRNADALSRRPCHRDVNPPLCVKCGPILDPIDELRPNEVEKRTETKVKEVNEGIKVNKGIIGSMLRADAPVFEPRWQYEWNREAGTQKEESAEVEGEESVVSSCPIHRQSYTPAGPIHRQSYTPAGPIHRQVLYTGRSYTPAGLYTGRSFGV